MKKSTAYSIDKARAIKKWEIQYFKKILDYYSGKPMFFVAKAIQMDRRNLLRKLKELKLGPYEAKTNP